MVDYGVNNVVICIKESQGHSVGRVPEKRLEARDMEHVARVGG